jgi:2-oxoglutarate dehydrogenase E1 component
VPLLIHGDAAFPGQGIVAECLNMAHLDGYTVGGAIHVVVNNQLGFTTNQHDLFSGRYCTDIAKAGEAPVFHVNGDDPEACVFVGALAVAYRQRFKNDVVIDLWCYRKYGHNEGDEPGYTQPLMYELIKKKTPVLQVYAERVIGEGEITRESFDALLEERTTQMDEAHGRTESRPVGSLIGAFGNVWGGLSGEYSDELVDTTVPRDDLEAIGRALGSVPEGFTPHRKLKRLLTYRGEVMAKDEPLDWAMGEALAFATLLREGHAVRLTGQDVERGTFSHRHAVLFDQVTGESYEPLNHLNGKQAKFCVHNSPLTESACVGFEYGYSLGDPDMLVIWEAQFGDFANGAQVIFDQFIASAEAKWRRFTGLTVFLPHGYEGQGPEHSSARLERFLTLCADNNMQIVYPTTPAQMFHLLLLQMKRNFRKPLVVMTPKSLLRHPRATSRVRDFSDGRFRRVIADDAGSDPQRISRVLLCTGKVYYDLIEHRESAERDDVAVIRIEQLYPFPSEDLAAVLARYPASSTKVWVQEEPRNMGAFRFVKEVLAERLDLEVPYVGRGEHPSPAVASFKMHVQEQHKIMIDAIGLPTTHEKSKPIARTG